MTEIEIGRGKRGRRAYSFDDIAIVPSRRTRDPEEVSVGWQIDAYHFDLPVIAAPMDSVMSPQTAIALGQLGGLPVLDLEGLWTRYEDPDPAARRDRRRSTRRWRPPACRRSTPRRSSPSSSPSGCARSAPPGVTVAGALTPQRTQQLWKTVVDAGVDLFVIRGTTVSAEHVSGPRRAAEPQAVHLRARRAGHRRRRRLLHGGPAPDAHRRGRRARRLRRRRGAHHPAHARHPRPDGVGRSPTSPPPAATTSTSPAAATCTSSPTAAWAPAATSSRRSPAARMP